MTEFHHIEFHPFLNNAIDYVDRQLVTRDGRMVRIDLTITGKFIVYLQGSDNVIIDGNLNVSRYLNDLDVGTWK